MTLQKIIERLLRSQIYRVEARIRTRAGDVHSALVLDLKYDGSRSCVLLWNGAGRAPDQGEIEVPLSAIADVLIDGEQGGIA